MLVITRDQSSALIRGLQTIPNFEGHSCLCVIYSIVVYIYTSYNSLPQAQTEEIIIAYDVLNYEFSYTSVCLLYSRLDFSLQKFDKKPQPNIFHLNILSGFTKIDITIAICNKVIAFKKFQKPYFILEI